MLLRSSSRLAADHAHRSNCTVHHLVPRLLHLVLVRGQREAVLTAGLSDGLMPLQRLQPKGLEALAARRSGIRLPLRLRCHGAVLDTLCRPRLEACHGTPCHGLVPLVLGTRLPEEPGCFACSRPAGLHVPLPIPLLGLVAQPTGVDVLLVPGLGGHFAPCGFAAGRRPMLEGSAGTAPVGSFRELFPHGRSRRRLDGFLAPCLARSMALHLHHFRRPHISTASLFQCCLHRRKHSLGHVVLPCLERRQTEEGGEAPGPQAQRAHEAHCALQSVASAAVVQPRGCASLHGHSSTRLILTVELSGKHPEDECRTPNPSLTVLVGSRWSRKLPGQVSGLMDLDS